jgi:hypothetical protein
MMKEKRKEKFEISIGNIPPKTRVTIRLMYFSLMNIEGDTAISFYLPQNLARTYNPSFLEWKKHWKKYTSMKSFISGKPSKVYENINPCSFSMVLDFSSLSEITEIISPSHNIEIEFSDANAALISYSQIGEPLSQGFFSSTLLKYH